MYGPSYAQHMVVHAEGQDEAFRQAVGCMSQFDFQNRTAICHHFCLYILFTPFFKSKFHAKTHISILPAVQGVKALVQPGQSTVLALQHLQYIEVHFILTSPSIGALQFHTQ